MTSIRGAVLRESGRRRPYTQSRPMEIETLNLDDPGPTEVLVRMEAASICHSDLSVVNGSRPRPMPLLLGHEASGRVVQTGTAVHDLPQGQRVIMAFMPRCEACNGCATEGRLPCERGTSSNTAGTLMAGGRRIAGTDGAIGHHLGVSGFATFAVVDRCSIVPVDDDVPPEVAALLGCAVLTGGGALLNHRRITSSTSVVIVGLGGVGMAGLLTAVAVGSREVIAVDRETAKLDDALTFGATAALTPNEAVLAGVSGEVVLEAVGHPRGFETALALTAPGGTLITVGLPAPDETSIINPLRITAEALTIQGSYMGAAVPTRDIPFFVNLWRSGCFPIERLISDRVSLESINEAMDSLADATVLRQIINF